MLHFFKNLNLFEVIIINIGLVIINLAIIFWLKHIVKRKYEKTQSVEEALYLQLKLGKYVQSIPIIATAFLCALTVAPKVKLIGHITGFIVLMIILIGMLMLILIFQQFIMHELNTMLRKTTATNKDQIKTLVRILLFSFIPMILFFIVSMLVDDKVHVSKEVEKIMKPLIMMLFFCFISIVMPLFNKYILKAVPLEDNSLTEELKNFLNNCGLSKVNLYLWPTKKNKVANALVSGLIAKDVFMSDYLLENFTVEESKAILAHEIGHIKKYHLWIRTGLILAMFITGPILGAIFEYYEAHYNEIPIWFGIGIFVIIYVFYMGFFLYYIKRIQERQADAYALELGIDATTFITALYKLNKLNNMVMKFGKIDEKFQTHPSTANRIKWIVEKSGIDEKTFREIRNSFSSTF